MNCRVDVDKHAHWLEVVPISQKITKTMGDIKCDRYIEISGSNYRA